MTASVACYSNLLPSIIVYYALRGRNWTFHVECDVSSINRRRVSYHTRLKSNFDRLLYIIFFITQIHTVWLVSINGEATRVRLSKINFLKKLEKKCWKKKFGKKICKKNVEKKNVGKKLKKTKIFITKIYSNIDKCHTIFSLLAPFDKTGRRQGKRLWYMIQNRQCRAFLLDARNVAIWTKLGEKIYHGLRAVGNSVTT